MALWNWIKKDKNNEDINTLNENVPRETLVTPNGETEAVEPSLMPMYNEKPPKNPKKGDNYFSRDKDGNKYLMTVQNIHELENGSFAVHSTGVRVDG